MTMTTATMSYWDNVDLEVEANCAQQNFEVARAKQQYQNTIQVILKTAALKPMPTTKDANNNSWSDGPPIPLSFLVNSHLSHQDAECLTLTVSSKMQTGKSRFDLPMTPPFCTSPTIAEDAHTYDENYTYDDDKDFDEKMEYMFNVLSTLKANWSSLSPVQQQHLQL